MAHLYEMQIREMNRELDLLESDRQNLITTHAKIVTKTNQRQQTKITTNNVKLQKK